MRRLLPKLLVALLLPTVALAAEQVYLSDYADEGGAPVDETASLWFVELSGPPLASGGDAAELSEQKAKFRQEAKRSQLALKERFAFDQLWNGFSVEVAPEDLAKVRRLPGVTNLYPVITMTVPRRTGESADLATALAMTGANVAQSVLGLSGAGVKVAVMDTGIDLDHPDLGGTGVPGTTPFPNARVIAGWDFVGDDFNANPGSPGYNPVASPDPIPDDCGGHGTHVAGIIGANGQLTGVAPDVSFGAYRVFGCAGSTTADIMIAAMERALADGMDVLNMSIGSAYQWPQYPTAQAADRLARAGVVVVASIGNSGASGLYSASAPGVGRHVIGVASVDNEMIRLPYFTVTPDGQPIGYAPATAAPQPPQAGTAPLARTGTRTSSSDACQPLPAGSLTGAAALIRRGGCSFHLKSLNAQNAGAAAVVIYNNGSGRFRATVAGSPGIAIPVATISGEEGNLLDARLDSGAVELTWTAQQAPFQNPTGGLISSFSSYGLAPDLSFKPDVSAPGGQILSTYPLEKVPYATLSGTSMAAPHVAGSAALLLQARPNTPRPLVKTLLQNTAGARPFWGVPHGPYLDNVHRQGAGMVDIPSAVTTAVKIEPSALALGESEAGAATATLTLHNGSDADVTYAASHRGALSTAGSTFSPGFYLGYASVAFDQGTVTVPAGGSATVTATISAHPGLANGALYGGYLVFTPMGGGAVLQVPYSGLKGDYQGLVALTPTPSGFPWLARRSGGSLRKVGDGATFTLSGADKPVLLVHLEHPVRTLRLDVRDAVTGKSWHRAFEFDYVGRNSTARGFFALTFDGVTRGGNKTYTVPDGTYVLELSAIKALGDSENPAHVERWTSPSFQIARP